MISRRGLLPHEHRLFDTPPPVCPDAKSVGELVGNVRGSAREANAAFDDWRVAIDGVRSKTNALWQAFTLADQRRFVRHVMPYWNVASAPDGTPGRCDAGTTDGSRLAAHARRPNRGNDGRRGGGACSDPRAGKRRTDVIEAGRIINCSGPEHDFEKLSNRLVRSLLAQGQIAPYPLGIGLQVAPHGAMIARDGTIATRLFAIGPVRYGTLIETTAIPEIRIQAQELAEFFARTPCDLRK
jgi:uncharacterized NAD(P)/FAD-binding protein YdhS